MTRINWKPLMSEIEAEEYTRGSHYEGQNFYHGTSAEAAAEIMSQGARLTSDYVNTYGDGFYLAFERSVSLEYARQNQNPAVISVKVNAKNPKKFTDSIEVERFCDENDIAFDDFQHKNLTKLLIYQGFDAIEIGGNRIVVVIFTKRQIAVYSFEEL